MVVLPVVDPVPVTEGLTPKVMLRCCHHFRQLFFGGMFFFTLQLSSNQNPGYLLYTGDDTTQVYWDYDMPLSGSLLTNVYKGFNHCSVENPEHFQE